MPDRKPSNPRLLLALVVMAMLMFSAIAIYVVVRG